ncbi:MAG: hypothetical protein AAF846_23050 [Chloroflexota bacterium]
MSEQLKFYTVDELHNLSLEELQALWELVPTSRQRAYRQAYEREVRNAGALGSDQLEQQVTAELLSRYEESALVPVGMRWARTPSRVQNAAKSDDGLVLPEESTTSASTKPSPLILIAGVVMAVVLIGFVLLRSGSNNDWIAVAELTPEFEPTETPVVTPTPTPLALEAQDDIIEDGDDERTVAYPVSLQVALPDGSPPRVWVVQRRAVRASEWNYDPNPDIASFINGMSVRPVMGIPFSDDNAQWFEDMDDGTIFTVTMNTGAMLRFAFAARSQVRRSDTDIFRQVSPGLVLLLIGERDEEGLPTATRTLITATYPPDQELGRDGELVGLTLPDLPPIAATATPVQQNSPFADVDVQIISVTTQHGQLTTRFRIYNGGNEAVYITGDDIQLSLGYVPNPVGPYTPLDNFNSIHLQPQQGVDISIVWFWNGELYGSLQILASVFHITI